jgi:hypothetical protein
LAGVVVGVVDLLALQRQPVGVEVVAVHLV